jgi:hypothetical protein
MLRPICVRNKQRGPCAVYQTTGDIAYFNWKGVRAIGEGPLTATIARPLIDAFQVPNCGLLIFDEDEGKSRSVDCFPYLSHMLASFPILSILPTTVQRLMVNEKRSVPELHCFKYPAHMEATPQPNWIPHSGGRSNSNVGCETCAYQIGSSSQRYQE